ncbi:23S rRNA (guanosine(2251)-2'-O)-methyltransferase RlmB [Candidatus Campbellbacteria bacterium]|nr:MAG: 23S rRNA (guanosine(2251)-2'-O)-methyltransferase RlmB [Candidatus Campbellbacteria bacterium]
MNNKKTKQNKFYIYGKNVVKEQLDLDNLKIKKVLIVKKTADNKQIEEIIKKAKKQSISVEYISQNEADNKSEKSNHQGVLALIQKFKYKTYPEWQQENEEKENQVVLILDKIEDVGNFGAILRSAAAFGASAVFVLNHNQAPVNGTVFKTSAGNLSKVNIVEVSNINQTIEKLQKDGFWIYALDMLEGQKENKLWDQKFDKKTAFILGSEADGVSQKVLENSDFIISVPMQKTVESLNVATTASLCLYEYKKQFDK